MSSLIAVCVCDCDNNIIIIIMKVIIMIIIYVLLNKQQPEAENIPGKCVQYKHWGYKWDEHVC